MNGKKAKALRRQAQELSIGMPDVSYRKYKPSPPNLITDAHGKLLRTGDWKPIVMLHACTRNIYKLLKQ